MTGFTVLQRALINAANGATDVSDLAKRRRIKDIDASKPHVGHHALASAWDDFTARWEIGVKHLCDDSDQFAARLREAASDYVGMDTEVAAMFLKFTQ